MWLLIIFVIPLIGFSQNAYINDFRVNDDLTNRTQFGSRIGVDSAGNFVVAWNDRRNSTANNSLQVYCQIFDRNGVRIGNNFRIGHDTSGIFGLTVLKDGKFICFWISIVNGGFDAELYFQRFDKTGIPLNPPTKVIDTVYSSLALSYGDMSSDSSGNFVIAWKRFVGIGNASIIYCQRYDSAANRVGPLLIANSIFPVRVTNVNVVMDFSGSFVVSWCDLRNNLQGQKGDIFFQRFDKNGVKLGGNILVNDDNDSTKEQSLPSIGMNKNGNFVITWTDERSLFNELNIYFQIYDSNGTPIGNNKRADESSGSSA